MSQTDQQIQQLQQQMQVLVQEVQRLSSENAQLKATTPVQLQKEIVEQMKELTVKIEGIGSRKMSLMDVRGLGKPGTFNNTHESWSRWSRTMENFVIGVFGNEWRNVIE